ncbi:hypothetical protein QCA50_003530 [Cerrena zonata]|uniref:Uncharacterized protein n=1 Tax=Cerrena zonata TaxID=2478898 RepID=A0AAW0GWJ3_9APHY
MSNYSANILRPLNTSVSQSPVSQIFLQWQGLVWLAGNFTDSVYGFAAQRSHYELKYLPISKISLVSPMYWAMLSLVSVATFLAFEYLCRNTRKMRRPLDVRPALTALSALVVPTTSRWTSAFITLARRATNSHDPSIFIPLSLLHSSVKSGRIELRNSKRVLSSLLCDELNIEGWRIRLKVEGVWQRRLRWTSLTSRVSSWKYEPDEVTFWTSTMEGLLAITSPEARTSLLSFPSTESFQEHAIPVLALDAIPDSYLPSFIRDLQNRSEKLFVLTCVTRSMTEPLQDTASILTSIPFLFPRYSATRPTGNKFANRSSQTFASNTSIYGVVKILTSMQSPFVVECMRNVSGVYANALQGYVERLETDSELRTDCVKACGISGWREEKFWSTWEAALFTSGMLSRWVLLVSKR